MACPAPPSSNSLLFGFSVRYESGVRSKLIQAQGIQGISTGDTSLVRQVGALPQLQYSPDGLAIVSEGEGADEAQGDMQRMLYLHRMFNDSEQGSEAQDSFMVQMEEMFAKKKSELEDARDVEN